MACLRLALASALGILCSGPGWAQATGLAPRYHGDAGIGGDPAVIFACDFEQAKLPTVGYGETGGFFDLKGYPDDLHITDGEAAVGGRSIELIQSKGSISPQWLHTRFPGQDTVYVRFYRKFADDWAWPPLGAHDTYLFAGEYQSPTTTDLTLYLDVPQGPSQRTDAGNWDLSRQPELVLRSSLQGPGLDFGLGREIVSHDGWDNYHSLPYNVKPAPVLQGGRWYCFEYMAKMNSPGCRDGEVRLWVDGDLVTEMTGMGLRNANHTDIRWDHFMLGPRYGGADWSGAPEEHRSWLDALVIATEYVGPAGR